jgi:hypothetical protein
MGMLLSIPMVIVGAIMVSTAWRSKFPKHVAKTGQAAPNSNRSTP